MRRSQQRPISIEQRLTRPNPQQQNQNNRNQGGIYNKMRNTKQNAKQQVALPNYPNYNQQLPIEQRLKRANTPQR